MCVGQSGVFEGMSVQQVALWRVRDSLDWIWDSLECVWGSECAASGFELCVVVSTGT